MIAQNSFKKRECRGYWWLPENPSLRVAGILKCKRGKRLELHTIGTLGSKARPQDHLELNIILGETSEYAEITLTGCFLKSQKGWVGKPLQQIYECTTAFFGCHFYSEEQIKLEKLQIVFSSMYRWVGVSGFENFTGVWGEDNFTVKYQCLEPKDYPIEENLALRISFLPSYKGPISGSAVIAQSTSFSLLCAQPRGYREFQQLNRILQNFLTFCCDQPIIEMETIAVIPEREGIVETCTRPIGSRYLREFKKHECYLINYVEIEGSLSIILKLWFEGHHKFEPAMNMFFASYFNRGMFLEQEFLTLIQALEIFHRRTKSNYSLNPEEHKQRIGEILETTSEKHKTWLSEKLNFSHEPSLKERLLQLMNENSEHCSIIIEDVDSFASRVKQTRHWLTHYDANAEKRKPDFHEIISLIEKMRFVFQITLLNYLRIDKELITRAIKRIKGYKSYVFENIPK